MQPRSILAALALSLLGAESVTAQNSELKPLRASGGLGFIVAQPVGEFGDVVDTGFGVGANFVLRLDPQGVLGLRADAGVIIYGHEKKRVCFSQTVGCRVEVDLITNNDIAFFNVGPELALPVGPVRPYLNGSIGYSYFATRSSINGIGSDATFSTNNFDDGTFAWQAGTGVRVPVSMARLPVFVDIGARYNTNGRVDYLREGDISDNPDGSITLNPRRSEANLVTFVIGASLGIRW
jgi:hypothetical protein